MSDFQAGLRSLAAGSLPHTDPAVACQLMIDRLDIPAWPQLPRRSFHEHMAVQYSERFPGMVVSGNRFYVDRGRDLSFGLEQLYMAYLMNDLDFAAIDPEYAAGLSHFLSLPLDGASAVKGQVIGPVSWGLVVVDQDRKPILYDEELAEAAAKHLRLKAAWMERELRKRAPRTLIFVDEPFLSRLESSSISLGHDRVVALLEEVLAGIEGLKGIYCGGPADWSLLLSTTINILYLDAYSYAESLAQYPEQVSAFLQQGGVIAWGIVPATDQVMQETVESLVDRFYEGLGWLTDRGVHRDDLLASALVAPSGGCGSLTEEAAERVLELTGGVAKALRVRYGV
ncbi:MAG: methionine synthase [Anaerolineae bacterium]